jgi:3-oxoacyl-[acyl-carrier-protein] synthase-3
VSRKGLWENIVIRATGRYLPARVLGNAELEALSGHDDAWIVARTGVHERRVAAAGETTSEMANLAAREACRKANLDPQDLDLIIVASVTGETHFPATACWLQAKLENIKAWVLDVTMGCAGFVYALTIARSLMLDGMASCALVIGADRVTGITDYTDPRSCILFGDGAGAVLLAKQSGAAEPAGIVASKLFSDGSKAPLLFRPLDATASPDRPEHASAGGAYMFMEGHSVYVHAIRGMAEATLAVLAEAGLTLDQVDWIVPHQANGRIVEALAEKLEINPARVYSNIARYGNTSAASVPICLDEMNELGLLREGQRIVLCSFGTGFTWGATLVVWGGSDSQAETV